MVGGGICRRIDKHYQVVKHDVNAIETMLDGIVMRGENPRPTIF